MVKLNQTSINQIQQNFISKTNVMSTDVFNISFHLQMCTKCIWLCTNFWL